MPRTFHSRGKRAEEAGPSRQAGSTAMDNAWHFAALMLRTGKESVADRISALADAAHDYSKSVALPHMQDYVNFGAGSLDRLSDYLSETEVDEMMKDAERFARRHPWAVISAGLASGVLAAQLLRMNFSSPPRRDRAMSPRRRRARKAGGPHAARKTNGKAQASA